MSKLSNPGDDRLKSRTAAVLALRDRLQARGVDADLVVLVAVTAKDGRFRTVAATDGVFRWDSGLAIGPVGDVDAAAAAVLEGLGLS